MRKGTLVPLILLPGDSPGAADDPIMPIGPPGLPEADQSSVQ